MVADQPLESHPLRSRHTEVTSPEPFATEAQLSELLDGFQRCALSHDQWNHRAHLAVACCLVHAGPDDALSAIRSGIKRLNASQGVVDSTTSGYHETITVAWVALIRDLMRENPERLALVNEALIEFGDKGYLLKHYSREVITSAEARAGWVEPDLEPLP